ncbi:MAG: epoxyqueuosine reductase QueH [Spirochaetaceae bacterium]|nr:epoxyqueuosine reductase QueH [Spirochaetaceae bacterium]
MEDKRLLLHVCCGPCSTTSIKRLIEEGFEITLWFSDDNIYPEKENLLRYENLLIVAKEYNLKTLYKPYNHQAWLDTIKGYESEKEGGKRCDFCFNYNLYTTELKAKELGIPHFATTLTVSRYKNSKSIFSIAASMEGFLEFDFKKRGGYEESIRLSKDLNLYRQHYCGCEFSLAESKAYIKQNNQGKT